VQEFIVYRFAHVVFGVSATPKCHLTTSCESFVASYPNLVKTFIKPTYIDDTLFGAKSEECTCTLQVQSYGLENTLQNFQQWQLTAMTISISLSWILQYENESSYHLLVC